MSTAQPSQMNDPFAGFNASYGAQQQPGGYPNQQQSQMTAPANDNPFAAFNTSPPPQQQQQQQQQQQPAYGQHAMVPVNQQNNQWGVQPQPSYASTNMQGAGYTPQSPPQVMQQQGYPQQPQQQQQNLMNPQQKALALARVPSSAQSIASSQYMVPHPGQSRQQLFSQQQQQPAQQQPYQNSYQNAYMQQQGQQQQQQPTQQQPTQQPPAPVPAPAPVVNVIKPEDEDFFGDVFSNGPKKNSAEVASPSTPIRPPAEFETDYFESVSVLSKSTNGTEKHSTSISPFDDPKFAPKPPKPQGLDNAIRLAHTAPAGSSQLPDFDLVTHSGYALSRISFRTILIKKWKQVFWVSYGASRLLVFRSSADFEDWISNPYLNTAQREFLVKLDIDLVADVAQPNVRGYQVTNQRLKNYNNKMLYQFKIERWMDYGPTIAAAFGSPNEREIFNLRTIVKEMLKRSPQDKAMQNAGRQVRTNDQYGGIVSPAASQPYAYPSSASTNMMYDQNSTAGRSTRSHPVISSGDVPGIRPDPSGEEAVAGYQVSTSRTYFQY